MSESPESPGPAGEAPKGPPAEDPEGPPAEAPAESSEGPPAEATPDPSQPPLPPLPPLSPSEFGRRPPTGSRGPVVGIVALAVALLVSLAGNGLFAIGLRDAQDDRDALRQQVRRLEQEIEALSSAGGGGGGSALEQVAAAISRIRGLSFKSEVSSELLDERRLRARVLERLRRDNTSDDLLVDEKILKLLGLIDPGFEWERFLVSFYQEAVGGYYDDEAKVLVVLGDAADLSPLDRVLLAHEYVHALTDQHFGLGQIDRLSDRDRTDQALAFLSLAEGDATLAMSLYRDRALTERERQRLLEEFQEVPRETLESAPEFVQRAFNFPYDEGFSFAQALYSRGGFAAIDRAYRDPPRSTEQILHPGKYIGEERDDPTPVRMPDVAAAMGRAWRPIDRSEVGELDLQLIVDRFLSRNDAVEAAAGWDGGSYVALESSSGVLLAALTVWDSESEAREATEHLGRWLPLRFGNRGSNLDTDSGAGRGWQSDDGAGLVLRSRNRVLFVLGPNSGSVTRARSAFAGF